MEPSATTTWLASLQELLVFPEASDDTTTTLRTCSILDMVTFWYSGHLFATLCRSLHC